MPATRTNSANESASPEPQQSNDLPERSRNAKAQARHREKRKAYISHLEQSVATLKQQLASMGISGAIPAHALSSSSTPAETDARLRELLEENERLKSEIQRLRSKVESLGGSASASSRSSTGHHGLTPPTTPGVLGGLGAAGSVSGALLPSTSDEYDARRGSVLPGSVESFLEGNSGQNTSHRPPLPNASSLFPSLSSSSSQVPLSLNIPPPSSHPGPSSGLGISGLANGAAGRSLSAGAGSHLAQARYSLPSPLPSALSSSSTPSSSSPSQFNPHFRVQSPFGTPVDPSSGWQIPRGSAPSILSPALLDFPPRGRELPLPAGFGLAPAGGNPGAPTAAPAGYDYHLMVSSARGSGQNGLGNEFPSAVPPLEQSGTVLPPFYGGNGEPSSSAAATLPPFAATNASYSYSYGLPPHHPQQQAMQQQQQQGSAPPSRANSQSRNDTTGSSSSSSPKSLSPASPVAPHFAAGASASFKMQLEGNGYEFGLDGGNGSGHGAARIVEQGQQWP